MSQESVPEGRKVHGPDGELAIARDLMLYGDAYCTEAPAGAGALLPTVYESLRQPLPDDAADVLGGPE